MFDKIKSFSQKYDMLPWGGIVLAAVSGGKDSMCLLHVLCRLRDDLGIDVEAAHFDHRLRGQESTRDSEFVQSQCRKLGIPCHVGSEDVAAYAKGHGMGIEEAGRKLRYDFFFATARKIGACRIATAHNADDNCETVIMNMVRGTGINGLCGIPPRRDKIVRPLIAVSRSEIDAYMEENSIPHVEDSTNASDDYTRNRIRHRVIPVLKEMNPDFAAHVANMTGLLAADRDYLDEQAEFFLSDPHSDTTSVTSLRMLPDPILSRVVRGLSPTTLSQKQTDSVLRLIRSGATSASVSLTGCTAILEYDTLRFIRGELTDDGFEPFVIYDGFDRHIPALGLRMRCERQICDRIIHKSFNSFLFKTSGLCGTITVRPRKTGDKLTIYGRGVTKTLKKLMIEERIPQSRREYVPVFEDEAGVFAVLGLGQDPRTVPDPGDAVLSVTVETD